MIRLCILVYYWASAVMEKGQWIFLCVWGVPEGPSPQKNGFISPQKMGYMGITCVPADKHR